jgi:hypothetical protein
VNSAFPRDVVLADNGPTRASHLGIVSLPRNRQPLGTLCLSSKTVRGASCAEYDSRILISRPHLSSLIVTQITSLSIMSYKAGIVKAISELKERNGSSSIAIKKHMQVSDYFTETCIVFMFAVLVINACCFSYLFI